jgi:DivIVA domain-containing protein
MSPSTPETESFDVLPPMPDLPDAGLSGFLAPPKILLSADKVAAVRFHPAKPGYSYAQVEAFVEQVMETLRYLELRMHKDDMTLHETRDEIQYLEEKVSTLQATIEVFRANGDPVIDDAGHFVTRSTEAITDELARARSENESLSARLEAATSEVDRAWGAEAELRRYLEEELTPWIQAAHEAAARGQQRAPSPDENLESRDEFDTHVSVSEGPPAAQALDEVSILEDAQVTDESVHGTGIETEDVALIPSAATPDTATNLSASGPAEDEERAVVAAESTGSPEANNFTESNDWDAPPAPETPATIPEHQELVTMASTRLASSPEVAAMNREADIDLASVADEVLAPRPAGTPLPRLLASSPEAAALEAD